MAIRFRRVVFVLLVGVAYIGLKSQCAMTLTLVAPSCTSAGGYVLTIPNTPACTGGGTPFPTPYNLIWGNASGCQLPTLTAVPGPGTYAITFTAGCVSGYNVVVYDNNFNNPPIGGVGNVQGPANPSTLSFTTTSQTQPQCFGQCNGSRTVFWNSSASPLTVSLTSPTSTGPAQSTWSNVAAFSPVTYTSLCAGIHTFDVTDANNCIFTNLTFTVTEPAVLNAVTSTAQPSCFGGSNGSFSVVPSGGTATYQVVFSNNSTVTVGNSGTATATGLSAGPVSATVTDSRGCTTTVTATIGQPSIINISSTQTNVLCGGACTGQASVAVTGGGGGYTYTWSPSGSNNALATGLCGGMSHVASITDANGCLRTHTVTITQPASITITPTITNLTCNNICTGAVSVTASGPPGTITYTWLAPPSGSVITTASAIASRCAGVYTLLASASPTCVNSFTIPITEPPPINLSAITQTVDCIGFCNGSATANVSGGNGSPYTFTWTAVSGTPAPQTGPSASNLCAGNYSLATRDASNCAATINFNIFQPVPFSFGITTTSITCNSACSGVINVSPGGGTAPYNYTLVSATSSTASSSPIFSNLCAGTYTLRMSDASASCAQQTIVTLVQPNPLVPSVNVSSITCANLCNGNLAGSANGGTPSYTLSWNTSTGTVAGGVLTNRCPGSYTFNITDANGCNSTPTVITLTAPPAITVNITSTNATCAGDCNGMLSANVSGGAGSYSLNWSTGFSSNPLTNLCAGNYTLNVTDANNCAVATTASVSAPSAIVLTQSTTAVSCAGSCDGSATITASGGAGTYTYQFNTTPPASNTSGIINNLCSGNYIATATDVNGCDQPVNFSISSPAALSAAITGTRNSCTSCTGAATVTASNGTPPYINYAWTNSLSASVGTGSTVSALCPGMYTVVATDSRSCVATSTVNISQIVIVTVVNGGTGIQCFGSCTGSAVASASGGQAPYTFNWSPGTQTASTATGLCAGIYTVNVTDSNNPACVNTATINIPQPPDITINSTQTNVSCFNTCDGAIVLSASGGTGPFTYSWSPGGMTTSSVSGLCQGIYTVIVRDANNCSKPPLTFTITPPDPPITATISAANPTSCNNPNTGSITVLAGGGNGTYTYSWFPTGTTASSINNVPAGTYSVFISSAGCTNTFMTTLTNPAGPALTQLSLQNVSCFSGSNGAVSYSATGTGPFSFTWTPALAQNTSATTSSVTGLVSGTYVIASTDAGNNCVTTETIQITQPSSVTANGAVSNIQCNGSTACDGSITVSPAGGTGPYTYTWLPGANNTATLNNLCAGTYTLNLRDNNLCPFTYTFQVTTPSSVTVSSTVTNVRCNSACNGSVVAQATGGTGAISYSWLPQAGFSGSTTATVLNLCPGTYTLHVRDGNNCVTVHTVSVTEPPALTSSLSVQNINCSSACNGSASLTASGGTPTYSFSWSSSAITTNSRTNLCAGNYTGFVTDANGCISSQPFTIASPVVFSLTLNATQPLCNAACNGSIQTIVSGAQGTVAFVWAPAGSGQNPVNLCAGDYTVNATDANGCQALAVVTLTNPPALLANISTTNASCNGLCTGVAVSTPVNAQGPVSYFWNPPALNTATNSGLCAGTYSLSIEDGNDCSYTQTYIITEPPLLTVNVSAGPASCGASNGSLTASPVGGTPNYTFAWSSPAPPPIATTGSFVTNLAAGIYTVAITDANNCTNTVSIPLSNSNGPTAPITSSNVLCNGNCTGAASVGLISNGTAPYATPIWVIPSPSVQAAALFSLCAGGYSVQLSDANNCITFTGTTISEPPPVSAIPTVSLPLCQGVCNGTVSLSTSGGVAPYSYTWMPGSSNSSVLTNACAGTYSVIIGYNSGSCTSQQVVNVTPQTSISIAPPVIEPNRCFGGCAGSATINVLSTSGGSATLSWNNGQTGSQVNNLCNGTYSVTITDQQGCFNTYTVPVTSPPQLTVASNITPPDCGNCNGSATVSAGGGSGSTYTYNWTNGGSGSTVSDLCAGLYQVQVNDSLNCSQTVNIPVNSSTGITGENISVIDESCAGLCDGAATVTAIGGSPPINYHWLNTASPNFSNEAHNLCGDVYFVQMTDVNGCGRTASVNIPAATALILSPVYSYPSCNSSDGSIAVMVSGGQAPYSYSWTPAAPNSATNSNLPAGTYTLTVTDLNGAGCAKTQVFSLSNPEGPAFSAIQQDISCQGLCNGSIVLSSTLAASPNYSWSNGTSGSSVTGLCDGLITVTVSANGCHTVRNFTISSSQQLNISSSLRQNNCYGECSGRFAVLPAGGTLPYTFAWLPAPGSSSNLLDSLCAGAYSVIVTDAKGCVAASSATITEQPEIALTSTVQNATCGSVADGQIVVEVSGGTPAFTYSWTGPGSFTSAASDLNSVLPGSYTLSITDLLNCSNDTVLEVIPTITVVANAGNDTIVCPAGALLLNGNLSQGANTYEWFELPQNTSLAASSTVNIASVVQSSTFVLLVVSPAPACFDSDTLTVEMYETPYLDAGPSYTIPVFSSVTIGGNPTTDAALSLTWSPEFYLNDQFAENPVASNTIDVTYTVSVMYGQGCIVSDTMQVLLYPEIRITSGFTPNGDGRNDTWIIDYIDQFPDNSVEIYNRWGELLFSSRGYQQPFDGTYRGASLPVGTYYYVIILNHPSYPKPYTGPLTIFR